MFHVVAYLAAGVTHSFKADTVEKAREIANRIITEGLWVIDGEAELFFPPNRVFKVKVNKAAA